jgi:hypothetical protein
MIVDDALALFLHERADETKAGTQTFELSWERNTTMKTTEYVYWQDEDMWLGYLEQYPDYWTQGKTREEPEDNLKDILAADAGEQI